MLAMPLGAAVATAQSGPSGMVALGPDQVDEDLPSDADLPIRASDLEGEVYASDHAGSLQITVTTPERASDYMGPNANVVADDEIAIVLADDTVHEGRDVAVDLNVLEAGVGYVPDVAYGVHDSGEEWQSPIEQEDGVGRFYVPEFSSNSVTFSGGIELTGSAAADGTNYRYELDNLNGVEDYSINLTGINNTASEVKTTTATGGDSISIDVGGNTAPENETVTLTGKSETNTRTVSGTNNGGTTTEQIDVDGTEAPSNAEITFAHNSGDGEYEPSDRKYYVDQQKDRLQDTYVMDWSDEAGQEPPAVIQEFETYIYASDGESIETEVYLANGDTDPFANGEKVGALTGNVVQGESTHFSLSGFNFETTGETVSVGLREVDSISDNDLKLGYNDYRFSKPYFIRISQNTAEVSVTDDSGTSTYTTPADGQETKNIDISRSTDSVEVSGATSESLDYDISWTETSVTTDPSIEIAGTTVSHSGKLSGGETVTESVTLSTGSNGADVSVTGPVGVSVSWTEVSRTRDPVVEVNGYETEYNGVLSEGETTSLATNEAWLQEGTNNVTVRTNTPSNGPESLVDMTYSHDASGVTKSVDAEATSWTESFNVSHTFPSAVADADATLTFDEQVAEIHDVEYRTNGGSWQTPPDYELNGTDLHVGLGDVEADTEIDVRATGHKVRAYDGAVKVTEPTVEGDDLSTEVEITDINPDGMFGLRVDETVLGDRLHYASEESWTGESAYASITSTGTQILRAPDANEGSTMRVSTAPVSVSPSSGAIEAEVEDGSEPTFSLRKGNTTGSDRIEVTYYNTVTGDRYVLWSETREVEVDADRAQSPVSFVTDGSSETYSILQRDSSVGPNPPPGPTETEDVFPLLLAFGGIGGVLVGSTLVSRRFNIGGWLLPVTATSLTAVAIQVLAPGSPLLRVAQLASESNAVTIAAVAALLIGMWQLDERTQGSVPWYVRGIIGVLSVVWALETISPGVILGGLRSGVESMGPVIVIVIVGGGAYLVREWIQARRAPDTVVEFQAGNQ
ncbi:hypothetical protein C467_07792 [Halorubrum hochstenium ATCC 700873]|uniref:Uncharacterized protein n=2 Tax=Haloferacaceae TaxID=1644056 RepID=M0FBN4_9EURY|nr:hypothetical protein C467_07792 [Halorubrum hochstenium ATCC 700873]